MANDRFQDLESPFLDEEVLPVPPAGETPFTFEDVSTPAHEADDEGGAADTYESDGVETEDQRDDSSGEADHYESEHDDTEFAAHETELQGEDEGFDGFSTPRRDEHGETEDDFFAQGPGAEAEFDFEVEATGIAAAETVDEAVAQPLFAEAVRDRIETLLDAKRLDLAVAWNRARHPSVSGISLATLRSRLGRYIDEAAVANAMRSKNALKDRTGDDEAVVAVMAHQFQQKVYASPKQCDGRIGEGTLDALGFVRHRGDALNAVDASNVAFHVKGRSEAFRRLEHLYASDRSAFEALGADVSPETWFRLFVNGPFLGFPFIRGIHFELMRRLRDAEKWLLQQPAYQGKSPVEIGAALGLDEPHRGGRAKNNNSMHTLGLATDIGYVKNPWVAGQVDRSGKPSKDRNDAFQTVMRNASRLMTGTEEALTPDWLRNLGADPAQTTETAYAEVHRRHQNLKDYLSLEHDPDRVRALVTHNRAARPGEGIDAAMQRWRDTIKADRARFKQAIGSRNPAAGFMNHHRDMVVALRDHGCLAWGAIDLGRNASGDMMHFDCRATGIGRQLSLPQQRTTGANHKCVTTGASSSRDTRPAPRPSSETATSSSEVEAFLGGKLWTFASRVLPMRIGIFCPRTAISSRRIEVLLYAHGLLSPCKPSPAKVPRDLITGPPFELGKLVDAANRSIVLVVPFMDWSHVTRHKLGFGRNDRQHLLGKPANVNGVIAEVLAEVGRVQSAAAPELVSLTVAGHSRAYDFLDPLAHAHADAGMSQGALARLSRVWALDTTYRCSVKDWTDWLASKPALRVHVIYRDVPQTRSCGEAFKAVVATSGRRLEVTIAPEGHCAVPRRRLPALLTLPTSLAEPEIEDESDHERFDEPRDLNETFVDDSEALTSDGELTLREESRVFDREDVDREDVDREDTERTDGDRETVDDEAADQDTSAREARRDEHAEECEYEGEGPDLEFEDKSTGASGGAGAPTVSIILDQPGESDDQFQLSSADGKYSKTLGAKDAKPLAAGEKVLTFTGVSSKQQYKLTHIRSKGSTRVVLLPLPFADLTSKGKGPRTAKDTYLTLPSQVPTTLADKYGTGRRVDPILNASSPQLVDLTIEDPNL